VHILAKLLLMRCARALRGISDKHFKNMHEKYGLPKEKY
jgi:hypothetical protein